MAQEPDALKFVNVGNFSILVMDFGLLGHFEARDFDALCSDKSVFTLCACFECDIVPASYQKRAE